MFELRRLLHPVEFTEPAPAATRHALALARDHGAELLLLHVLDAPHPQMEVIAPGFDLERYYEQMEQRTRERLAKTIPEEESGGVRLSVHVARGKPSLAIVDFAREQQIDLIVMPTRRLRTVDRLLLGATAGRVVRRAPCPVLTVPPSSRVEPGAFHKIVHPTDFSEFSDLALPLAMALADRYQAELTLLHVMTLWNADPANPEWRFPELPAQQLEAIEAAALRALRSREKQAPASAKVVRKTVRGFDPDQDIIDAAEEIGADLIVMATHGRSGVAHFLLGSTTEKVVRHARCPVMTIRPPENVDRGAGQTE
jgi:nucleotide-binding universal stress UspA family protein